MRRELPGAGNEHSHLHQVADFFKGFDTGKPAQPDFRDAQRTQVVRDALLESAKELKWEKVGIA